MPRAEVLANEGIVRKTFRDDHETASIAPESQKLAVVPLPGLHSLTVSSPPWSECVSMLFLISSHCLLLHGFFLVSISARKVRYKYRDNLSLFLH